MAHEHHHNHSANRKTLLISLIIITVYMVVEVIGGFMTNSLALLADAGHMVSDAVSLFIALLAFTYSGKAPDYQRTYGYKRFEVLAAVTNGVLLITIAIYIFIEAIERFQNPPTVASKGMLLIAVVGLLVNILVAWIMMRGSNVKENINMRGAFQHVMSDVLGSVGAIVAALLILFFNWTWADPVASVIVAILVLRSGYWVTKSSIHILMEGVPENVDAETVKEVMLQIKEVISIHDLHIWTITSGLNALSCHVVVNEKMTILDSEQLLRDIENRLEENNIHHVTIQLETPDHLHDNSVLCHAHSVDSSETHHH